MATLITVANTVNAPAEKVWEFWNNPDHVTKWNAASPDWHTPIAFNDLQPGGKFNYRMEAKDGSFGFDFGGVYDVVEQNKRIAYTMGDNRKVNTLFTPTPEGIHVETTFEAEDVNSLEQQQFGWQSILDNFKVYAEKN